MGLLNKILKRKKDAEKAPDEIVVKDVEGKDKILKQVQDDSNVRDESKKVKEKKAIKSKKDTKEVKTDEKEVKLIELATDNIAHDIIVHPMVTEKSAIAESMNQYSFIVTRNSTKTQIKKAVKDLYGVDPIRVCTANIGGRQIRFKRLRGRRKDYKKATVTLPKGKSIDIHVGV